MEFLRFFMHLTIRQVPLVLNGHTLAAMVGGVCGAVTAGIAWAQGVIGETNSQLTTTMGGLSIASIALAASGLVSAWNDGRLKMKQAENDRARIAVDERKAAALERRNQIAEMKMAEFVKGCKELRQEARLWIVAAKRKHPSLPDWPDRDLPDAPDVLSFVREEPEATGSSGPPTSPGKC